MKKKVYAFGIGLRRQRNKTTLDVLFPLLARDTVTESFDALYENIQAVSNHETDIFTPLSESQLKQLSSQEAFDRLRHFPTKNTSSYYKTDIGLFVLSSANTAIQSTEEAYLKLQLLSQRLNTPHSLSLDGLFGVLENIAWTNKGPILIEDITQERLKHLASDSPLKVSHIDKFPYLVDYACPSGVRIASGSQVRLGAYLAEGTTVMPAGYVNFNAGSLGEAMIEGRVSAGVIIGDKTDIGGGASIMGTLSGGNKDIISIGKSCLLGANAGTGISLGNGCTIAAGLYLYAGMKIALYNVDGQAIDIHGKQVAEGKNIVKAKSVSGRDNLLFIQDSRTGRVSCRPNQRVVELNSVLHQND